MASIFSVSYNRPISMANLIMAVCMAASASLTCYSPGIAHELWIAPQRAPIQAGEKLDIDIFVGENFTGNAQIYLPRSTELLAIASTDGVTDIHPRVGSRPAISFVAEAEGHVMMIYQSADDYVSYGNFEKFEAFINKKKAGHILDQHRKRGLPEKNFTERYKRFAKTSMFIGAQSANIAPNDTDMELEFILLDIRQPDNSDAQEFRIKLTYQEQAVPYAPLGLYVKSEDGQVTHTYLRTDHNGEVIITTRPLQEYLLDHVVVRALDPETDAKSAIWESLWASLSFSRIVQR
jgi:cobalt/nickel transport protein